MMKIIFSKIPRPVLLIAGFSLLLAVLLLIDAIPFLRGGFGWQWPYDPAPLLRALPLLIVTTVYGVGAWGLLRRTRRALWAKIWAFIGVIAISLAVIGLTGDVFDELFFRTASLSATGPHFAAAEIDWTGTVWHDWPAVMDSYYLRSPHLVLSPPGLPMFYGALNAVLDTTPGLTDALQRPLLAAQCSNYSFLNDTPAERASAWFGMLMPLWAAITVFPLYAVARRLHPQRARLVVIWWPLVPALIMFSTSWNTVFPLFSLVAFWLLLTGLENRPLRLVGAGLLSGLATFANFSLVPLIAFCGFYTLLHYWFYERDSRRWIRPVIVGVWYGIGLIVPWLIFWVIARVTPFDMLQTAMNVHLDIDRPYVPWLWLHFYDWAIFTGIPLILLWLIQSWKRIRGQNSSLLGLALLLTIALVIVSNTARGETGRVWLFFAPFVLISAAGWPPFDEENSPSAGLITLGQVALTLALAICWPVMAAADMHPSPQSPGAATANRPADAIFGDQFRLVGWDAVQDGNEIVLMLNWQGLEQMTTPYWFAGLLVDPEGQPAAESQVWQALDTRYPTTCWRPDEIVGDSIRLVLPDNPPPGDWWISLTAFADTRNPAAALSVSVPDQPPDIQIGLGPVSVGE